MWVSTAMVASPKATFITTFAVLRPTPGSASSSAWVCGTWPPWRSSSRWLSAITFLALVRNRPIVLMCSISFFSPNATISAGVLMSLNNGPVARLTPTSVACADSTTATSR